MTYFAAGKTLLALNTVVHMVPFTPETPWVLCKAWMKRGLLEGTLLCATYHFYL